MAKLADPLRGVVGEKAAKRLATLGPGLRTVGDLLSYYPRRYETRGELTDLAGLRDGEHVTVQAMIASVSTRPMRNRRGSIFEAVVTDGRGQLTLTFFGKGRQDWRERRLAPSISSWPLWQPDSRIHTRPRRRCCAERWSRWSGYVWYQRTSTGRCGWQPTGPPG